MADGIDNTPYPPRFFTRLLIWFCDAQLLEELQGDLEETYYYNHKTKGAFNARRLYIKEIIFLIRPSVVRKLNMNNYNNTMMIKNYAKVSFRNLLKYKLFSFINIFGLAVAMSVCLLIILMLADQHQYDGFHVQKDRIYRILTAHTDGNITAATSPFSTAQYLDENYSLAERTTTLRRGVGGDAVFEQNFSEMIGYFADPEFFNVFSYDLSKGNPATALINPNSMIISEEVSQKLFGNINPLGKIVEFTHRGLDFYSDDSGNPDAWGNYTITGVIPIKKYKTHLKFDVLISSSSLNSLYQQEKVADVSENWSNYYQTYNYVLLNPSSSEEDLSTALAEISKSKFSDLDDMKVSYLIPQSILDFRPGPLLNNTPSISLPLIIYYILGFMALIVLVLACLNYTNLSVARAITRSKEIGIRKVTGARRKDLLLQFLSESVITALLALVLANVILYFVKSAFMGLWVNKYLNFELTTNLYVYLIFVVFSILLGLIAGVFPALQLSKQQPVTAIKGLNSVRKGKLNLRKVLTVSQFATSLIFIITSIVIYNQFKHFMSYDYGFQTQNILNINLQSNAFQKVKNTLLEIPGVNDVSGCDYLPSTGRTEIIAFEKAESEETISVIAISASLNFINVLDFEIVAGEIPKSEINDGNTMIINRSAVEALGYDVPSEIIGQSFETTHKKSLTVSAVIEDFTFHLLFNGRATGPVLIRNAPELFTTATISISAARRAHIVADIEQAWKSIDPIHPFTYEFYEDNLASNNQGIFDILSIVSFIAFMAITIASLGLLGIVIYSAERRTREVGIRKVLGAGNYNLAFLLSKEFLQLLLIAIAVAAPLAYLFNNFWLDFMATRVAFGAGTLLLGSLVLLIIGLLTIGTQTFKAAASNPVEALKNE